MAAKYGRIVFRCWKDVKDETTRSQWVEAVQTLAHVCIHAADDKLSRNLLSLLGVIHTKKAVKGVDYLLTAAYDPIIWRAIECPNAKVRAQACALFLNAFPLRMADESSEQTEQRLERQYDAMDALLKDEDHLVRDAAVEGVSCALKDYLQLFPISKIKSLLLFMCTKLIRDVSSAQVRVAVVDGLGKVLSNPVSHKALIPLMKSIAFTVHDRADQVRAAFLRLLGKAHEVPGLHFYDIVSLEELLSRLRMDRGRKKCHQMLMQLLKPSFYPQNEDGSSNGGEQLERCLSLIEVDVKAAEVFYGSLFQVSSIGSAAKISILLFAEVIDRVGLSANSPVKESIHDEDGEGGSRIASILKVLHACLSSIADTVLDENHQKSRQLLLKYFTPAQIGMLFEYTISHENVMETTLALKVVSVAEYVSKKSFSQTLISPKLHNIIMFNVLKSDCSANEFDSVLEAYMELLASSGELGHFMEDLISNLNQMVLTDFVDDFGKLVIASPDNMVSKSQRAKRKPTQRQQDFSIEIIATIMEAFSQSSIPRIVNYREQNKLIACFHVVKRCSAMEAEPLMMANALYRIFHSYLLLTIQTTSSVDDGDFLDFGEAIDWMSGELSGTRMATDTEVDNRTMADPSVAPSSPFVGHTKAKTKIHSSVKIPREGEASFMLRLSCALFDVLGDFYICFGSVPHINQKVAVLTESLLSSASKTKSHHTLNFAAVSKLIFVLSRNKLLIRPLLDYLLYTLDQSLCDDEFNGSCFLKLFSEATTGKYMSEIYLRAILECARVGAEGDLHWIDQIGEVMLNFAKRNESVERSLICIAGEFRCNVAFEESDLHALEIVLQDLQRTIA